MKKALIYSIEIILLIFLYLIYYPNLFPILKFGVYVSRTLSLIQFKTFFYSMLNEKINYFLDRTEIDVMYIILLQGLEGFFKYISFKISYYEPVDISPQGKCTLFFHPIPYVAPKKALNIRVLKDDKECLNYSIRKDWLLLVLYNLSNNLESNISIDLTVLFNKVNASDIDIYSLFLFDPQGNMLKIRRVNKEGDYLYLQIENAYNPTVYLVLRYKKDTTEKDLEYLRGRYSIGIVQNVNPVIYSVNPFDWVTIAVPSSCTGKIIVNWEYPALKRYSTNDTMYTTCEPALSVKYSVPNFYRYFIDLSEYYNLKIREVEFADSIVFPGLVYKKIIAYVS